MYLCNFSVMFDIFHLLNNHLEFRFLFLLLLPGFKPFFPVSNSSSKCLCVLRELKSLLLNIMVTRTDVAVG